MPRPLHWLLEGVLALLSVAFALMLAATAAIIVLTSSSWGLGVLLRGASVAGIEVQADRLDGSLFGPIELRGLRVRLDDGTRIEMARLSLAWNPGALWLGELHVTRFEASDLRLFPAARAPGAVRGAEAPLLLGIHIAVDAANADRFLIVNPGASSPTQFTQVRFSADWNGNRVHVVDARAVLESYGPLQLSGDAELFRHSLRGDALHLTSAVSGVISGTYQYDRSVPSRLHAHITSVEPYLRDTPISEAAGEVDVTGSLGGFSFDTRCRAMAMKKVPLSAAAHGKGTLQGLHFDALDIKGPAPSELLVKGDLNWRDGFSAELAGDAHHLDLSPFVAGEKSDLNGTLSATSRGSGGARDIRFRAQLDHSTLRGLPFALTTEGDYARRTLALSSLRAESAGHTHLSASGTLLPSIDLQADLDSNDLGALYPGVGGAAYLHARLSGGAASGWHLVSQGHLESGRGFGVAVQHLVWDGDVDWLHAWRLQAQADHLQVGFPLDHASLSVTGPLSQQAVEFGARSARGEARLSLTGAFDPARQAWDGRLVQLRVAATRFPAVSLSAPAPLSLSAQRIALGQACLAGNPGQLCVQATWQSGSLQGSWHIPGITLDAFAPLLPPGWVVRGQLQGDGRVALHGDSLDQLQGKLAASVTEARLPGAPPLRGLAATLEVVPDGQVLHAHVDLTLAQGRVHGELASSLGGAFRQRPLSGAVSGQVPDISFAASLFPEMQRVHGSLHANATLGGTLGEPTVTGEAELLDGEVSLETPGITLKQLSLRLHGDGSGVVHLNGRAVSDGPVTVDGQIDLADSPVSMDLHIVGTSVKVMDHVDARVWVSPDLHLLRDQEALRLTGTVGVPRAEISPKTGLGSGAKAVSQDQILLGRGLSGRTSSLPVRAQVAITLGNGVHFKGFGLTSRLEGSVTVSETPGQETHGQGELRLLDGRYKAYGQDLKIEAGRLIFTGGVISSPAIDIRASRQPTPQITVGVHVRGTLAAPELALESDPVMSREDILGWLLLGQPLSQSSSDQKAAIQSTALSLGVMGSSILGGDLTQKLGVNLSVASENTASVQEFQAAGSAYGAPQPTLANGKALPQATAQSPQLTLGKYLSPRLFISYGVSVFTPGQTVNLQYDIGHGFKVQTETGTASGGDLLYTVEKGLKPKKSAEAAGSLQPASARSAP